MTGFQSRVRDAINQAAPTYATVTVADRGLSHFIDPSMTGAARFMQKSGFPFPLLTPQMSAPLTAVAASGTLSFFISGQRLLSWLIPGMTVSFELLEEKVIDTVEDRGGGIVLVTLTAPLASSHDVGTGVQIRAFPVSADANTVAGDGGLGSPFVPLVSPFILVPGDLIVIGSAQYTLDRVDETAVDPSGYHFNIQVTNEDGLPVLDSTTPITVLARAAYRSEILSLPQTDNRSVIRGPVALDFVSGPMVADYVPDPESVLYIEEFSNANTPLSNPRQVAKNHVLVRQAINRDQMLFWNVVEGSVNWNGNFMELRAFDSGRAHLWTPCRPVLNPAPVSTVQRIVPLFAPYTVLLQDRIIGSSVVVVDAITKAVIPSTDYVVDETLGTLAFVFARAGSLIDVTFEPRLEWQVLATPSEDNLQMCFVVGRETKQVFNLGPAGLGNILTIEATGDEDIDQLHVTARRLDDSGGNFIIQLGDWQPRGSLTAAIRYTIATGADVDYDWASSGLLVKAMWPTIELLRARLDGDSLFARYLDNGRMLF